MVKRVLAAPGPNSPTSGDKLWSVDFDQLSVRRSSTLTTLCTAGDGSCFSMDATVVAVFYKYFNKSRSFVERRRSLNTSFRRQVEVYQKVYKVFTPRHAWRHIN